MYLFGLGDGTKRGVHHRPTQFARERSAAELDPPACETGSVWLLCARRRGCDTLSNWVEPSNSSQAIKLATCQNARAHGVKPTMSDLRSRGAAISNISISEQYRISFDRIDGTQQFSTAAGWRMRAPTDHSSQEQLQYLISFDRKDGSAQAPSSAQQPGTASSH